MHISYDKTTRILYVSHDGDMTEDAAAQFVLDEIAKHEPRRWQVVYTWYITPITIGVELEAL